MRDKCDIDHMCKTPASPCGWKSHPMMSGCDGRDASRVALAGELGAVARYRAARHIRVTTGPAWGMAKVPMSAKPALSYRRLFSGLLDSR
jgi:hypothetical protein